MPSTMKALLFTLATSLTFANANPFLEARGVCNADNCARAITGTGAQQPLATRQADCSAFMSPIPTPTVPTYASACGGSVRYSSACSCLGYTAPTHTACLSPAQATSIVNTFASLLTAPQAADFASKANALLADSFTDTSGSINLLASQNISGVTFPSKAAFLAGQGAQPPIPTVTTLDIFYTCNKIAWRWVGKGIGSGQYEVKGIDTFTITPSGQISEVYAEFNSGAWLADIGNPQCSKSNQTSH
ncbi:hypothetical protein HRR81_007311 [Exophiala dermatitidis]|uniref:NTF2-like domain-containing protein n=1 Tax=Exophiala dermatitidis TaxID=5970 RepID=A0AAN6EPT8_EXODE|nr:hypothetical protein HRR75_006022 [Exophiala dermatitidis]KAJ4511834.1 hypothetical protein HRR74_006568 [Exophiala dermatitidis]KAJ4534690.1 hypothetical protein HRR76_006604 [Exophiala dermatitidis]KAJ4545679.1 hypothetical protein HRR78_005953 [Exophiala dermatitidis]KAJ4560786.1 hypothetical protein HRR79_007637 [Exophiala dermatitidis]